MGALASATDKTISKKDMVNSRISDSGSKDIVFYHLATPGQITINLLSLTMPTDLTGLTQAATSDLTASKLWQNKKSLTLLSSANDTLIQGLHYDVVDSTTIRLKGPYAGVGAEEGEIFEGRIANAALSGLIVASAKSVTKSYTLPLGQTLLSLGQDYRAGAALDSNVGFIKVFIDGVLASRNTNNSSTVLDRDYYEVVTSNGYGSSIVFNTAPVSSPYTVIVDFGVRSITDNDSLGAIESLRGSVLKLANDLSGLAGTSASDYIFATPSDVDRRTFGEMLIDIVKRFDTSGTLSAYVATKFQEKALTANVTALGTITALTFNNLEIGKRYCIESKFTYNKGAGGDAGVYIVHDGVNLDFIGATEAAASNVVNIEDFSLYSKKYFVATATTLTFNNASGGVVTIQGTAGGDRTRVVLSEADKFTSTTQWT